jgi:dynein heavy chain
MQYIKSSMKEVCQTEEQNLVCSLMWIYRSLLVDYENEAKYNSLDAKLLTASLTSKFIFSLVWSLGGSLSTEHRKPFDTFLKRLLNGDFLSGSDKKKRLQFPDRATLYDFCLTTK